jgi:hypothetical protein
MKNAGAGRVVGWLNRGGRQEPCTEREHAPTRSCNPWQLHGRPGLHLHSAASGVPHWSPSRATARGRRSGDLRTSCSHRRYVWGARVNLTEAIAGLLAAGLAPAARGASPAAMSPARYILQKPPWFGSRLLYFHITP